MTTFARSLAPLATAVTLCALPAGAAEPASAARPADKPLAAMPYSPSLDLASMDRSIDPCTDFYAYACGGWMKANPIPADEASWSVYGKLEDDTDHFLWGLLEQAADPTRKRSAVEQKVGDYFAACMDEARIEQAGARPLEKDLAQIAALTSMKEVAPLLARAHLGRDEAIFSFGSDQDFSDSTQVIAFAKAGCPDESSGLPGCALGLQDRDFYLKDDAHSKELRAQYVAHAARMLQLLGDKPEAAKDAAERVMKLETALATATLARVDTRDPYKLFHKMKRAELKALTPAFDWDGYLEAIGAKGVSTFNVTQPGYYQALQTQLTTVDLATWKDYLRWHRLRVSARYLSTPFARESFEFYEHTLSGVAEMRPRWKRCVSWVDRDLGEALGRFYVEKVFSADTRQRAAAMSAQIRKAMESELKQLSWMGPQTRKHALEKLHTMVDKIGYPDRWRDYGPVEIKRDDFFGDVQRASVFENRRQLAKIGKPLDRSEWEMTPPTVNAYYNPQMNDLNFPAGVLQPPLFDARLDDAPNYGNTGATIGHELTHGFDDEGRQFDARGNLKDWWTEKDAAEFQKRAACVSDQYAQYVVVDDIKINSKLSLGEDVADLGGTLLAYKAWKSATQGQKLAPRDELSPDQRFFVGMAQWACSNERPEHLRERAVTNPHSPDRWRINGVVVNMPEFARAFSCKADAAMVKKDVCVVW